MGIDYRSGAGYGIAWSEDSLPDGVRRSMDDDHELGSWLNYAGLDKLSWRIGGDMWSGSRSYAVLAQKSIANVNRDFDGSIVHLHEALLMEIAQLYVFADRFGIYHSEIGWKLFHDVL